MQVIFGIWQPELVRLSAHEKSESVALWIDEEHSRSVSITFPDRKRLLAFAAKIQALVGEEQQRDATKEVA